MSKILAALSLVTLTAAAAHADTLYSPSVEVVAGELGNCRIVNLGSKPVEVAIEEIDTFGAVLDSNRSTVGAGATRDEFSDDGAGTFRCRFTGAFKKSQVRAIVAVFTTGGPMRVALPAE